MNIPNEGYVTVRLKQLCKQRGLAFDFLEEINPNMEGGFVSVGGNPYSMDQGGSGGFNSGPNENPYATGPSNPYASGPSNPGQPPQNPNNLGGNFDDYMKQQNNPQNNNSNPYAMGGPGGDNSNPFASGTDNSNPFASGNDNSNPYAMGGTGGDNSNPYAMGGTGGDNPFGGAGGANPYQ